MIDISLAGLLGAIVGTIVAGVIYHMAMDWIERRLLENQRLDTAEDPNKIAGKLALVRRSVLIADLAIFAGGGYWLADRVWG